MPSREILAATLIALLSGASLAGSEQSRVSQAARPTLPTEYSQCDRMNALNLSGRNELSQRWGRCHSECTRASCNGWRSSSSCSWPLETFGTCLPLLEDMCQFERQSKSAFEECREKVTQY